MKRLSVIVFGSSLVVGITALSLWFVYLEPRLEIKNFLSAVQPIIVDQYESSIRIKTLLEDAHKQRVGFYDPVERQKLIRGSDKLGDELRTYQEQTERNIKIVEAVRASKETVRIKTDLLEMLRSSRASTVVLSNNINYMKNYMKSLIVVVDRYNPELKSIRQKMPATPIEAIAQLDRLSDLMINFNDELDGLAPTRELADFHSEFLGVFADQTLFDNTKDALSQRDLNRVAQLKPRFILMDASMDGRNIESTLAEKMKIWIDNENKIYANPLKTAQKLQKKYGGYWTGSMLNIGRPEKTKI
ncbi:MAG TPA: hypothetical protein ENI11_03760 [Actinobacteria bacterium]|nr:hypothetical protein [Actinomycetota bacterium]